MPRYQITVKVDGGRDETYRVDAGSIGEALTAAKAQLEASAGRGPIRWGDDARGFPGPSDRATG